MDSFNTLLHIIIYKNKNYGRQLVTILNYRNPQLGFELAITLSRRGVKYTQPDGEILHKLRPEYANNADSLTAASQVVAINFQTVSAANNYCRDK